MTSDGPAPEARREAPSGSCAPGRARPRRAATTRPGCAPGRAEGGKTVGQVPSALQDGDPLAGVGCDRVRDVYLAVDGRHRRVAEEKRPHHGLQAVVDVQRVDRPRAETLPHEVEVGAVVGLHGSESGQERPQERGVGPQMERHEGGKQSDAQHSRPAPGPGDQRAGAHEERDVRRQDVARAVAREPLREG